MKIFEYIRYIIKLIVLKVRFQSDNLGKKHHDLSYFIDLKCDISSYKKASQSLHSEKKQIGPELYESVHNRILPYGHSYDLRHWSLNEAICHYTGELQKLHNDLPITHILGPKAILLKLNSDQISIMTYLSNKELTLDGQYQNLHSVPPYLLRENEVPRFVDKHLAFLTAGNVITKQC